MRVFAFLFLCLFTLVPFSYAENWVNIQFDVKWYKYDVDNLAYRYEASSGCSSADYYNGRTVLFNPCSYGATGICVGIQSVEQDPSCNTGRGPVDTDYYPASYCGYDPCPLEPCENQTRWQEYTGEPNLDGYGCYEYACSNNYRALSMCDINEHPTQGICTNGVQDDGEEGIDCGGPCSAACEPKCPPGSTSAEVSGDGYTSVECFRSIPPNSAGVCPDGFERLLDSDTAQIYCYEDIDPVLSRPDFEPEPLDEVQHEAVYTDEDIAATDVQREYSTNDQGEQVETITATRVVDNHDGTQTVEKTVTTTTTHADGSQTSVFEDSTTISNSDGQSSTQTTTTTTVTDSNGDLVSESSGTQTTSSDSDYTPHGPQAVEVDVDTDGIENKLNTTNTILNQSNSLLSDINDSLNGEITEESDSYGDSLDEESDGLLDELASSQQDLIDSSSSNVDFDTLPFSESVTDEIKQILPESVSTCRDLPIEFDLFDVHHSYYIDCDPFQNLKDILGWFFYVLTAIGLFYSVTKPVGENK